MISKYTLDAFDFKEPTNAQITKDIDWTKTGYKQGIPVLIAKYMPGVQLEEPKETSFHIPSNVFANQNSSRPNFSSNTLKILNYVTCTYEDSLVTELSKIATPVKNKYGQIVGSKIPKGAKVRAHFMNGKLSKPMIQSAILQQEFEDMTMSDLMARDITKQTKNNV